MKPFSFGLVFGLGPNLAKLRQGDMGNHLLHLEASFCAIPDQVPMRGSSTRLTRCLSPRHASVFTRHPYQVRVGCRDWWSRPVFRGCSPYRPVAASMPALRTDDALWWRPDLNSGLALVHARRPCRSRVRHQQSIAHQPAHSPPQNTVAETRNPQVAALPVRRHLPVLGAGNAAAWGLARELSQCRRTLTSCDFNQWSRVTAEFPTNGGVVWRT
jgi:hypothetical protein